jgi:hypothetical protein
MRVCYCYFYSGDMVANNVTCVPNAGELYTKLYHKFTTNTSYPNVTFFDTEVDGVCIVFRSRVQAIFELKEHVHLQGNFSVIGRMLVVYQVYDKSDTSFHIDDAIYNLTEIPTGDRIRAIGCGPIGLLLFFHLCFIYFLINLGIARDFSVIGKSTNSAHSVQPHPVYFFVNFVLFILSYLFLDRQSL